MTTYTLASGSVVALLNKVVQRWHHDLAKFEVRIGILMAHNDNGAAVKAGGYPAFACIKPVPHEPAASDRRSTAHLATFRIFGGQRRVLLCADLADCNARKSASQTVAFADVDRQVGVLSSNPTR